MEITPEQKNILAKLTEFAKDGPLATFNMIVALEKKVEELSTAISLVAKNLSSSVDVISGELKKKSEEELLYEIDPKKIKGDKGDAGKNFIPTEKDLARIAAKVKVPVVKKIIERTKVVHKQPIVTNNVVEVTKTDKAAIIRDKLETLKKDERLDKKAIKGLESFVDQDILNRAISILDERTQFLIAKVSNLQSIINSISVSFPAQTAPVAQRVASGNDLVDLTDTVSKRSFDELVSKLIIAKIFT